MYFITFKVVCKVALFRTANIRTKMRYRMIATLGSLMCLNYPEEVVSVDSHNRDVQLVPVAHTHTRTHADARV